MRRLCGVGGGGGYVSYSVSARTRTHPLGRSSLLLHSGCLNLYRSFIFLLYFLSLPGIRDLEWVGRRVLGFFVINCLSSSFRFKNRYQFLLPLSCVAVLEKHPPSQEVSHNEGSRLHDLRRRSVPLQYRRQEVRLFPSENFFLKSQTRFLTTTTTTKNAARRLSNTNSKARSIQHAICGLPGARGTACAPTRPEGTHGTQTEAEAEAEAEAGRREGEGEGGYRAECQGAEEEREGRGW